MIRFKKVKKLTPWFHPIDNIKNVDPVVFAGFYVTKMLINCAKELKQRLDFVTTKTNTFASDYPKN